MRVLVTGANGFVGRRMCSFLTEEGHDVRRAIRAHDNLENTIEMSDSSGENTLLAACAGVDCVIHLAAAVHITAKVDAIEHDDYWSINVDFPLRLAEAAHKVGVRRFVFVSSVKVYGEMSSGRALTETDKAQPSDLYAFSKWAAEQSLRVFAEITGLELVIVRAPLVYGPGVRANFLALLSAVNKGLPLPLLCLTNKRSMVYIDNFVSALSACATHPQVLRETFNVADIDSVSLPALVNELAFALGRRSCLLPIPRSFLRVAATAVGRGQQIERLTNDLELDSRKIQRMLGWFPTHSFREGIQKTVGGYLSGIHQQDNCSLGKKSIVIEPLKICQLCAVDFTMGHLLLPLIDGMREQGWSVTSACSEGRFFQDMRRRGYQLHAVSISRNLYSLYSHVRSILEIYRLCRDKRFDVLHIHTPVAAFLGRIAGRMAGVPLIIYTAHGFYFHDEMPSWKYRFFVLLERWGGLLTDYLLTQSNEDARVAILKCIAKPTKVTAIGNGVCVDRFKPDHSIRAQMRGALAIPPEAFVIGIVARLVREKGLLEFLEAAVTLSALFPNAYFIIVGERLPSDRDVSIELELRNAKEKLGAHLLVLGYRADVVEILGALDLFCLPSYREGMPRSIIEAMMMELAVVATDIRGIREEVIPGETGLLVPTKDSAALIRALQTLIADPELNRKMGCAGRRRALKLYDERFVIARQIEIIGKLSAASKIIAR